MKKRELLDGEIHRRQTTRPEEFTDEMEPVGMGKFTDGIGPGTGKSYVSERWGLVLGQRKMKSEDVGKIGS